MTGAGRGLGRSHAELLASRGASVLIADADNDAANEAAAAIAAAGGKAVAKHADVTTDALAIVQAAIDAFGKLDVVVNNAGIDTHCEFDSADVVAQTRRHMEINFLGSVAVTAAAWPHLVKSGNGRVVNTSSPTLSGWEGESPYVASKGALFAWTRTLALEALPKGIRVNAIAPTAYTRMAAAAEAPAEVLEHIKKTMLTSMVSPVVAYLAHDDCSITGETILAQGGLIQRFSLAMNDGYNNPGLTPEDVGAHLETIVDDSSAKPLGIIGGEDETSLMDLLA
ncbi:SDR family oxidoreductase [Gordonia sp. (in: high G+C Gram-positive bacteria)]|uniref:SDR family oxidoreductase n=1 Tax=Gordonia sp. (in: high G+C Gram-positive bacteria) TaxID=84139 RepID=UPI0039E2D3DE